MVDSLMRTPLAVGFLRWSSMGKQNLTKPRSFEESGAIQSGRCRDDLDRAGIRPQIVATAKYIVGNDGRWRLAH